MMKTTSLSVFLSALAMQGHSASAADDFELALPRNLSFFSFFASEKNEHKLGGGRLDCVYGDPVKGKMCPPVMKDPMADLKAKEEESALETFSRCLDDPDDPECRELQAGDISPGSQVAQAPAHLRSLFGATLSPTIDDCGGNMFDPRFCASAMPSVSAAPTLGEEEKDVKGQYRVVQTMAPTLCEDRVPSPFVKTAGSDSCPVLFDDDNLPIVVEQFGFDAVSVKLVNTFPGPVTFAAMSYTNTAGKESCVVQEKPDVAAATSVVKAKCDASGFAYLEVVAASKDFKGFQPSADIPKSCTVPKTSDAACSYVMAIPCACFETGGVVPPGPDADDETMAPTSAPSVMGTNCEGRSADVQLHLLSGKCPVQDNPVILASRTDKFAILELVQTWGPKVDFVSALFVQNGKAVCASDKDVTKKMTEETPLTYTVDCGPGDWASLYLYVKDSSFKSAGYTEMPPLCAEQDFVESTTGICSYKLTVSCLCNLDAPSVAPSFAPSFSPSAAPSFAPSAVPSGAPSAAPSSAPSSAPSAEIESARLRSLTAEGTYQCSAAEYGCDDGPNHVSICHYTSRIGYRTYCVPEADSEIVRFYKSDYCGKCKGGFTVGETGEVS